MNSRCICLLNDERPSHALRACIIVFMLGAWGQLFKKAISLIQDQWKICGQNYKDVDKDV